MQNQPSNKIFSISGIHNEIEKIIKSVVGDISKQGLKDFIYQSWDKGEILFNVDECYHSSLEFINGLDKDKRFSTASFYLPHQLPSTSTLLYTKEFAARLVHDSAGEKYKHIKFNEYNIEPHHHEVDSIIIATSKCKLTDAEFIIHDSRLKFDTVVRIPFGFASVVCFPRFVNHTFLPSDVGLSTLNITDSYVQPHTNGFSHPAPCNFDDAVVMSYNDYQTMLNTQ
ncbi:hypothetical protein [Aliterella atlantica]|uniref:Uncharacterized protein n=1 Tax=Aliterella atlantica CENA595 TaxID=1618023 RepID=A0A0D8ZT78_9CYAN|nr:hypothetical protein [Aliterella atlantica]KJH71577.1 hypothetical protein UH38_12380 [Aliterella atlantica CENA595]